MNVLRDVISCDFLRTMCNIVKPPQAPDPRLRGTLRICQGPEGLLLATHIKNTPTDPGSILGKITHPCQIILCFAASVADISSSSITQAPPRAPRPSGRWDVYTWSAHRSPVASSGILKWWQWRGTCSAPKMARGYNQQRYIYIVSCPRIRGLTNKIKCFQDPKRQSKEDWIWTAEALKLRLPKGCCARSVGHPVRANANP